MTGVSEEVNPIECPGAGAVGVPRRFGVGVLMILVTFFAVLFAFLRSFDYGPKVCCVVGVLFVGVAAGQALLFGGKRPREASALVGAVLFPLEMVGLAIYESAAGNAGRNWAGGDVIAGVVCSIPAGAMFGYGAGCVTAGIFLVMDRWSKARDRSAPPAIELQGFAGSDIDTLLEWVDSPRLLALWAGSTFVAPLDRPQLERHLRRAGGDEPELLAFKAVRVDTGQTAGYVELSCIDRSRGSANVGLAIVGCDQLERGQLSVALLRAVLGVAFDEMGLHRVEVALPTWASEAVACYRRLGFMGEGVRRDAVRFGKTYGDLQIMSLLRPEWLWLRRPRRTGGQTPPSARPEAGASPWGPDERPEQPGESG